MLYGYYEQSGSPFRGNALRDLKEFLERMGLRYDEGIEYTVAIRDGNDRVAACASLQGNVIKCVAVDPSLQGEGITATLMTAIKREALERGQRHLFLYTKPENGAQFGGIGFYEIARTDSVLLMENRKDGFVSWVESVRSDSCGTIGAAVMNCNPMTLGHRYLIERAAEQCDLLYLFIVSEDKSAVPAADRRVIVEETVSDLDNVRVVGTDRYLISSATFPDYFIKDQSRSGAVWTGLDIAVFCRAAKMLGITKRFVGSEPFCAVTSAYNGAMAEKLPGEGIEFIELPRFEMDGSAISATAVRRMVAEGRMEELKKIVPEATVRYFEDEENRSRVLTRMGISSSRES